MAEIRQGIVNPLNRAGIPVDAITYQGRPIGRESNYSPDDYQRVIGIDGSYANEQASHLETIHSRIHYVHEPPRNGFAYIFLPFRAEFRNLGVPGQELDDTNSSLANELYRHQQRLTSAGFANLRNAPMNRRGAQTWTKGHKQTKLVYQTKFTIFDKANHWILQFTPMGQSSQALIVRLIQSRSIPS